MRQRRAVRRPNRWSRYNEMILETTFSSQPTNQPTSPPGDVVDTRCTDATALLKLRHCRLRLHNLAANDDCISAPDSFKHTPRNPSRRRTNSLKNRFQSPLLICFYSWPNEVGGQLVLSLSPTFVRYEAADERFPMMIKCAESVIPGLDTFRTRLPAAPAPTAL